jgi:predicted HNH restriction endonuclease
MGEFALRGFDVHHQEPLKDAPLSGRLTSTDDLCILCLRCHRLAHASGAFTVTALRTLLAAL